MSKLLDDKLIKLDPKLWKIYFNQIDHNLFFTLIDVLDDKSKIILIQDHLERKLKSE